jgi:hypothetical protein
VKTAIELMVGEGLSRKEAAERAGMTDDGLRRALATNPVARRHYSETVRTYMHGLRHKAVRALEKEMDGPNAAARVASARTILEASDSRTAQPSTPTVPGLVVVIQSAELSRPVIDVTPAPIEGEA